MGKHGFGVLLLLAAFWSAPASAWADGDEDPRVLEAVPPRYPPEAARAGITGTTVLVIDVTAKGEVGNILVEKSAADASLDAAAVEAARKWTFAPARVNGRPVAGRVRMPVDFNMGDDREYHPYLARMAPEDRVPPVPMDERGRVPGYIRDPLPIGADTVAEAHAMLQRRGRLQDVQGAAPGLLLYVVADGKEYSQWWLHTQGRQSPSLVRRRLATDGIHGFFVTRTLCEAADTSLCFGWQMSLQETAPQPAIKLPADDAAPVPQPGAGES